MIIKSKAVVLHTFRYGDNDVIAKLFTRSYGLQSYVLKGIVKSRKGKVRNSLFLPLSLLEIEGTYRNRGSLERIKEARIYTVYEQLHIDIIKNTLALFIADVLKHSIKEGETDLELYDFIETSLLWLDHSSHIANFHIVFLIKLTRYFGFFPDISGLEHEYFNLLEGIFQNHNSNPHCIKGGAVEELKVFLGTTFDESVHIKLSKDTRIEIIEVLLLYFKLHLFEFKQPKSLAILNEIFS